MVRHKCSTNNRTGWLLGVVLTCTLSGCGSQAPSSPPDAGPAAEAKPSTPAPGGVQAEKPTPAPSGDPLHVSFEEATSREPPDDDQKLPPDVTRGGKVIGKIHDEITRPGGLWDQVKFVSPTGKKLRYRAVLKTSAGDMTMELYPEAAPNHVRNFVALARAGYYDGLCFERAWSEEGGGKRVEYILAGCPLGTGEGGIGHLGYWLKPELNTKVGHEIGAVGAWHDERIDTACCRFYVNLAPAPWLDVEFTVFGKITHGLDVARTIHTRPRQDSAAESVLIRQVVIVVSEGP